MRVNLAKRLAAAWLVVLALAVAGPAHAEQRVALVIANSAYTSASLGRLPGTRADAAQMVAALTAAGFKVRSVSDLDRTAMRRAIADFAHDLGQAGKDGVGFLYYSGHGIADSRRGQNYLIPVDADVRSETDLPIYAEPMDEVLDAVEAAGAKAAFVVFDACRSTPTSLSRGSKGLQPARARTDTLIAFATAPGETAADDGLYARVLAAELKSAGSESDTLFQRVQRKVAASTGRRQVPEFVSRLAGDSVQFVVGGQGVAPTQGAIPTPLGSTVRPALEPLDPYARWGLTKQDFGLTDGATLLKKAGATVRFNELARSADAGDSVAQTLIGFANDVGVGTAQDYQEAMRWYRKAAELGVPRAMRNIGFLYESGKGVTRDYAEAMRWYRKAADLGQPHAVTSIGVLYGMGQGVTRDYAEAMRWYRKAADLGEPIAMRNIGYLYDDGQGVQQDYSEAMRWYRKAADLGQPGAIRSIGFHYAAGQGVTRDYAEAMRWYRRAADLGDGTAPTNIGYLYANGQGVTQDYAEAMRWYRKAADLGEPIAMKNIGNFYRAGEGVTQDYAEAMRWYRKAADLGDVGAIANIGYLYGSGLGVTRDYVEAMRWYRKAADLGEPIAMKNIAVLYRDGFGVPQDYAEARRWFEKAAALGDSEAKSALEALKAAGH